MSDFRYQGYNFNLTSFREFVQEFNIMDNQRASADALNKSVNKLKREVNQLIGQFKILTSKESIRWDASIIYEAGEIVSYITEDNPDVETIKNSYYLALPSDIENQGYYPDANSDMWKKVTLNELYPWLDVDNYPTKTDNDKDWPIVDDYDVINLKYLKWSLEQFKDFLDGYLAGIYIKQDNKIDLEVSKPTHVTTKKYVDVLIDEVKQSVANIDDLLTDYVFVDSKSKQLQTRKSKKEAWLTTEAGLLPGLNLISTIGSTTQQFKAMYAQDFIGTALKAKYADLAEVYETDKEFEVGAVLGINENSEIEYFDIYKHNRPLGVVSDKPGFILNKDCKGVLIALKGQTPVIVKGSVKAGDELYAEYDGYACVNPRQKRRKIFYRYSFRI
ncbi:hypothetical protein [Campylobacter phage CP21]|uniref:Uncharacterized protein n=1 Tax=Campylobacter phage CP21 TaxID=2881391 RepID=I7JVV5_9CAUD|nr:hypothetical protein F421_gp172 [Campylobacter phage CP21]CCH63634.1 hypothetical protein [Campylobacter phage CP21]